MNTPVNSASALGPQVLGKSGSAHAVARPAVVNHYNIQRSSMCMPARRGAISVGCVGRHEGAQTVPGPPAARNPHRGSRQVQTMQSSFIGLGLGLLGAIVLVYLLIVVNFQSWLDPLSLLLRCRERWRNLLVPADYAHHTQRPSLTVRSCAWGWRTANSILMVSFARDRMDTGVPALQAALEAGYTRMRPVLDDSSRHDYRHASDGVGLWRGRRAERTARPVP